MKKTMSAFKQARLRRYPRRRVHIDIAIGRAKAHAILRRSEIDLVIVTRVGKGRNVMMLAAYYDKLYRLG